MTTPADAIVSKVAKLLALAEHPNTSDVERDTFLAKADALMAKHMIDEALLRAAQTPAERRKPVVVEVNDLIDRQSVFGQKMLTIARQVARTVGVRLVVHYADGFKRRISLVGFDEDVRWMQMLFMNIQMTFLTRITPKWDNDREFVRNIVLLRESGLSWSRVLDRAVRAGAVEDTWTDVPFEYREDGSYWDSEKARWSAEDKLNRAYRNECKRVGVAPVQITRHEAYRHTYSEAFTQRICARLEEMEEARQSGEPGTALALRTVKEDVDAAMWEAFPNLSPEALKARRLAAEEQQRKADEALAARLAAMTPAQRLRYEKEQTAEREKFARESDRYWRRQDRERERLYDYNGGSAGRSAADSVNLSTAERMGGTDRKALAQ